MQMKCNHLIKYTSTMQIKAADRLRNVSEYYFSQKLAEVRKLNEQGYQIINLGIGNPDLPVNKRVVNKLNTVSRDSKSHYYQPYKGTAALRHAFSNWYQKMYQVKLDAETEILPLAGSKEGIMLITMAFVNPGDTVLIPNPGYPAYESVAKLLGANVVKYNLDADNQWQPNFEELNELDLSNCKLMWVNYPNMPTGAKASKRLFSKLIEFGLSNNVLVCNDNPYSHILNKTPLSILKKERAKETCLELNSLSKSHNMQGFRVGMVGGHKNLIQHLIQVKSNYDSGMYLPVQEAAVEALSLDREWYDRNNQIYQERKDLLREILSNLGLSFDKDSQGMFVWCEIPKSITNGYEYSDHLLSKYKVFAAPGGIFGSNGNRFIRFSLCGGKEEIIELGNRIKKLKKIAV